jgi:hypothetical protein
MSRMEVVACLWLGIALTALASPATVGTEDNGRTIWIADAHRDDGKRFVVHADEKLTAFPELEAAIRTCGELS